MGIGGIGMVVRAFGPGATALSISVVCFVLGGAAVGHAQTSPPAAAAPPPATQPKSITGFVPTYEIMRTVRAAGFQPLEPPLREGRTYVLRATDYRGILMHVVVDARTGAIRDVTHIVGPYGMMPPPIAPGPYGPPPYAPAPAAAAPPYGPPPYEGPAEYERPGLQFGGEEGGARRPGLAPPARPAAAARADVPPLPRPRPIPPNSDAGATDAARAPVPSGTSKTVPIAPFND
jgi:hypothetical protein